MRYILSKKFVKNLSKLKAINPEYEHKVGKALKNFAHDPGISSLRLHKISASEDYSISVDMSIRIIIFREGDKTYLLDIGKHEDVY